MVSNLSRSFLLSFSYSVEALVVLTIDQFKEMNQTPVSLSRLRVLRAEYKSIIEYVNCDLWKWLNTIKIGKYFYL